MRLTSLLSFKKPSGRSPQLVNKVPIIEIMPLKLKERVSGKSDVKKEGGCLYEMSLLIACLQENEYENKLCQKQADNFSLCYKNYLKDKAQSKIIKEKGTLIPGEKNLTYRQVKKLFNMQPLQ